MPKKKERILVREDSPPSSDSGSVPDSEAMRLRRKRKGFPVPEAVALLESFLKEVEEKIEETEKLYSRGRALTNEEIGVLDRKVLGIAAIRRSVGERIKKVEEDCRREMEEILEGGGKENERDEKMLSYLLTILPPSRNTSSLTNFLENNDFCFKIDSTFEVLAPFAKSFVIKDEENAEILAKDTEDHAAENQILLEKQKENSVVTTQSNVPMGQVEQKQLEIRRMLNKGTSHSEIKEEMKEEVEMDGGGDIPAKDHSSSFHKEVSTINKRKENSGDDGAETREKVGNDKPSEVVVKEEVVEGGPGEHGVPSEEPTLEVETSCGNAVTAQPKVRKRKVGQTQLRVKDNEDTVKKELKEEEVEEMGEGVGIPADQSISSEAPLPLSLVPQDVSQASFCGSPATTKRRRLQDTEDEGSDDGENRHSEDDSDASIFVRREGGNEEKKCPMDGCAEKLSFSEDLAKHMKTHMKPMICGVCKSSWQSGAHLRRHYRMHSEEKLFKCDDCGFKTNYSNDLTKHKRTHTGEKPYKCTVCKMSFAQSSHVTRHMRTHTGERPYECDICGYKTSRNSTLKNHQLTHTSEKAHVCTSCGYKATRSDHLSTHKKRHAH